jgi:hypothetical protein
VGGAARTTKVEPVGYNVVEKVNVVAPDIKPASQTDTTAFVTAAERLTQPKAGGNADSDKNTASVGALVTSATSPGKSTSLPTSASITRVPNPTEEDKAIWLEIFGTPFDPSINTGFTEDDDSDVVSSLQRAFVAVWEALDDLFSDDCKEIMRLDTLPRPVYEAEGINVPETADRPTVATASAVKVLATLSFLRRGLTSAEALLLDLASLAQASLRPNFMADAECMAIYHKAKSRLLTALRAHGRSPALSNTLWVAVGMVIVDAIVRQNGLFSVVDDNAPGTASASELIDASWSAIVVAAMDELGVGFSAHEIGVLRTYFD